MQDICPTYRPGLFCAPNLLDGISFSSGVKRSNDHRYGEQAWVPAAPWIGATKTDLSASFLVKQKWDPGRTLYLGFVSGLLLAKLRLLAQTVKDSTPGSAACRGSVEALIGLLSSYFLFSGDVVFQGLYEDVDKCLTTSFDEQASKYVGLHRDTWDKLVASKSASAQNRLSINIGRRARALLIVPLRVDAIPDLMSDHGDIFDESASVTNQLFSRLPWLPVFRMVLPPGGFYVAPTDNIIHDGSTEENWMGSESMVFRGRVSPLTTGLVWG